MYLLYVLYFSLDLNLGSHSLQSLDIFYHSYLSQLLEALFTTPNLTQLIIRPGLLYKCLSEKKKKKGQENILIEKQTEK